MAGMEMEMKRGETDGHPLDRTVKGRAETHCHPYQEPNPPTPVRVALKWLE